MEKLNLQTENSEQELRNYSLQQIKRYLAGATLIGLSLVALGCREKQPTSAPENREGYTDLDRRFDRAAEKIDQTFDENQQIKDLLKRHGVEIKPEDAITYQKEQGKITEISVNGKEVLSDILAEKEEPKPESKTSPEAAEFF